MVLNFLETPSAVEIPEPPKPKPQRSVIEELEQQRLMLLKERQTKCKPIPPIYTIKRTPLKYTYRFYSVCQRYRPAYCCKHSGNIIIDRDVLTKAEHMCFLSQPKPNLAARRDPPRYFYKKTILPDTTERIVKMALPHARRAEDTFNSYSHLLQKRQFEALQLQMEEKPPVVHTRVDLAISYIHEERRLRKVARRIQRKRCRRYRKLIMRRQRKQIRRIICVLFEEMKDFLLNDQFVIDDRSALCSVILQQIRDFTDKEFYTTNNLRDYQQILANNLAVWINKFISNLDIQVEPAPQAMHRSDCGHPASFLPVDDYISLPHSQQEEEECAEDDERGEHYFTGEYYEGLEEEGDRYDFGATGEPGTNNNV